VVPPLFAALVERATSASRRSDPHAIPGAPDRFYPAPRDGSSGCSEVFSRPIASTGLTPTACSLSIDPDVTCPRHCIAINSTDPLDYGQVAPFVHLGHNLPPSQ
jgi:hypothetical protein